ncbi:hypothetical protein SDC9_174823 [bioreactor metagenome]|uniref:Uncharacterized protein n=1 Tax=bioreactor metagenome TaxID=1076179 RepID=A0A645GK99_9ZZZZ
MSLADEQAFIRKKMFFYDIFGFSTLAKPDLFIKFSFGKIVRNKMVLSVVFYE